MSWQTVTGLGYGCTYGCLLPSFSSVKRILFRSSASCRSVWRVFIAEGLSCRQSLLPYCSTFVFCHTQLALTFTRCVLYQFLFHPVVTPLETTYRVFGEVPDSVKQSLAAKEALRDATAGSLGQDGGEGDWMETDRKKRGKVLKYE